MNLFLSYTMRDGSITAQRLQLVSHSLEAYGSVFADAIHNKDLDRQARVEREIAESDLIIFIETKGFHESHWVNREQQLARSLSKRAISVRWLHGQEWESTLSNIVVAVRNEAEANNNTHASRKTAALHTHR